MTPRSVAGALLILGLLAAGNASAAQSGIARLPKPRPATTPPTETVGWANTAEARFQEALSVSDGLARLPRPRPSAPELAMVAPDEPAPPPAPHVAPPPDQENDADFAACAAALRGLGVDFEAMPPIHDSEDCDIAHPLRVTALGSGVSIAPETVLNCATTRALATWVRDALVPESVRTLGVKPDAIRQDSAYVCRNRYDDPSAKISEHARANAIDIADFAFADRNAVGIGVNAAGSAETRFESAVRADACRYFTTVLGPGSNAAHATHFHFDMAQRSGGYRLCELGAPPAIARALEKTTRE